MLIRLSNITNRSAMGSLSSVARDVTSVLHFLTARNPEYFARFAPYYPDWPVMASNNRNSHEKPVQEILKSIKLGEGTELPVQQHSRWTRNDRAGKIAWSLFHYISMHRLELISFKYVRLDFSGAHWLKKVSELKPFGLETWKEWWNCARDVLNNFSDESVKLALEKLRKERKR